MATSLDTQLLYAALGGFAPALIWLYFWLREDLHPEPKRLLLKAFAGGALAIPFALLLEALFYCAGAFLFLYPSQAVICGGTSPLLNAYAASLPLIVIIGFAAIEEYVKYKSAKRFVLKGKDFDEPVDAMIYLITVALGFAAFENILFLFSAFGKGPLEGLIVSNLRFLGATLLHALSSGIVGYAIALSFYRPLHRGYATLWGLLFATGLHALFNITIIKYGTDGVSIGISLLVLILTGMFLIFAFDRAKKIQSTYVKE